VLIHTNYRTKLLPSNLSHKQELLRLKIVWANDVLKNCEQNTSVLLSTGAGENHKETCDPSIAPSKYHGQLLFIFQPRATQLFRLWQLNVGCPKNWN